jgi:hypothetical protein
LNDLTRRTRNGTCCIKAMPSLEGALEYAGQLVSDNYANVAIDDGKDNQVSGDDLIACYLGVMKCPIYGPWKCKMPLLKNDIVGSRE